MTASSDSYVEVTCGVLLADCSVLSPRQRDIAQCILCGHSDKQIAGELDLSVSTVRTHLSRLFEKLQVQDRGELALWFVHRFLGECAKVGCHRLDCRHN